MAFSCGKYTSWLLDRTPHYDEDILRDWFPTDDAWVGQVLTGTWEAGTGTEHTYDRIHVAFPDESGCWEEVDYTSCLGSPLPCKPDETCVGWGTTRKTYGKYRKSYSTMPICFDQVNSIAKAKENYAQIIRGLKDISAMVQSNWLRTMALQGAETLYVCGAEGITKTINAALFGATNNCNILDLGSADDLPTSRLTVQYLDMNYETLQFSGYFKSQYLPSGMFKVITDPLTARDLVNMNPSLVSYFRFEDFQKGGQLFKIGVQRAVGNYGLSYDGFPMRFVHTGTGHLQRVFPYTNVAATVGIKPQVASEYITAPYQISYIWHPEAMRYLSNQLKSVHPEMPFLLRDQAGKWRFVGPESDVLVYTDPGSNTTCTVDNKRRNQGMWFADFEAGIKYERPELVRAILHLREPGCVVDAPRCSDEPDYVVQDNSSCVAICDDE